MSGAPPGALALVASIPADHVTSLCVPLRSACGARNYPVILFIRWPRAVILNLVSGELLFPDREPYLGFISLKSFIQCLDILSSLSRASFFSSLPASALPLRRT